MVCQNNTNDLFHDKNITNPGWQIILYGFKDT